MKELNEFQDELIQLHRQNLKVLFHVEVLIHLKEVEGRKSKILDLEEESRRLKSIAIWLSTRDRNTKIFHQSAMTRRAHNTIWDIHNEEGIKVNTFSEIAKVFENYFQDLFENPGG